MEALNLLVWVFFPLPLEPRLNSVLPSVFELLELVLSDYIINN